MKYNITTLKKEVPKHIRLEVYKEALKRKDWINRQGLCVVLPKILFNIAEGEYLADIGEIFTDSTIAFPELTLKTIEHITRQGNDQTIRIQYLEQWIGELEGHNEQNNTEK